MSKSTLDEVNAALEAATDEAPDSSTDANDTVEADSELEEPVKAKGKGAQSRIQELVAERKAAEQEVEEFRKKYEANQVQIDKLTDYANKLEEDSNVVQKIKHLYRTTADPDLKAIIESVDKAIKGESYKATAPANADKAEDTKTADKLEAVKAELLRKQDELAEQITDQKARAIVAEADGVIASLMKQLPDNKYDGKDREVISHILDEQVNWEAIEGNPDKLVKEVEAAFQKVVTWYGDPRGALKAQTEDIKNNPERPIAKSIDEIVNKNWGKLKETSKDRNGRSRLEPAVSDADFAKVMGELMRKGAQ